MSQAQINDIYHGVSTLDVGAQILAQATRSNAPMPMIRGVAEPIKGWIEETKARLMTSDLDEEEAEELGMKLFDLSEIDNVLAENLEAGASHWNLYCIADAMQQTTKEMVEMLWKDGEAE